MNCDMKEAVLAYLKGEQDIDAERIEKHIEECPICGAMVEGYMEKEQELSLELEGYGGDDDKLKERVVHYHRGFRRIVIFTLVGLIMGWLSIYYYTDNFLPTKIILAVPYKMGEMLHNILHQPDYRVYTCLDLQQRFNEFFPGDFLCTFLAERIVPVLFGGAIYGSIAYFTGDKRVFTLRRYMKFAGIWAAVILAFTGIIFGMNSHHIKKADKLQNVDYFFLYSELGMGSGFGEELGNAVRTSLYEKLHEAFYENGMPVKDEGIERNMENEVAVNVGMGFYLTEVYVNYEEKYLVTASSTGYRISDSFAGYVKEFWESGKIDGESNVEVLNE
ncbi:MAG: hypothetical protein J6C64_16120 [Lachnospiraceae bacterium]|nr:hypothetical protein [Lachnospiraceae bacterium]